MYIIIIPAAALICAFIIAGFRITRPIYRGVVETFGLFTRYIKPGLHWIVPGVQKIKVVRVTEQTYNLDPQLVSTSENLNIVADAHIYIRIKPDEKSVRASLYNADDCIEQTVDMARTALRNVFAAIPLKKICGEREQIGEKVRQALKPVTEEWGVEIIRCVLKEVEMPKDVQEIMQKLVTAENEKLAATDFAAAAEINADGLKRAEIRKAEGAKQARILAAEAEAKSIRLISEAAQQYFNGNAQLFRLIESAENALKNNSKIIFHDTVKLFDTLKQFGCAIFDENEGESAADGK